MAEQKPPQYWVNVGKPQQATIHREGCGFIFPDEPQPLNSKLWLGPYASLGAAIDAAMVTGRKVVQHHTSTCIANPVTTT